MSAIQGRRWPSRADAESHLTLNETPGLGIVLGKDRLARTRIG